MVRDIDRIIDLLGKHIPGVEIKQLEVAHPGVDDDGLWYIKIPGRAETIQIESSSGSFPFTIESDFNDEKYFGRSVLEVVGTITKLLAGSN